MADNCDQTVLSSSNNLDVQFYEATAAELAADPSSVEYNQALGLQGSLADVTIKLQDTAQTPVQYIGDVTALFAVLNGSQGIVGMDLRLIGPLQRDANSATGRPAIANFSFGLTCQKNSDTAGLSVKSYVVQVTVLDANDNAPQFLNTPYSTTINELTQIGTTVFQNIATQDLDSGLEAMVSFGLVSGDGTLVSAPLFV
jgi:hypothetical protein